MSASLITAGNAIPSQVLNGTTFSADALQGVAGTMPNNGALGVITPTTTSQSIPSGFISSGTVAGDANLVAPNIIAGTTIFGVAGTGSNIKSIQKGQAAFGASATSVNIAIATVVPANAIVIFSIYGDTASVGANVLALGGQLTSATQINFVRPSATATALIVIDWQVIEFNSVKSKQTGITNVSTPSIGVTVSAVNTSKCMLYISNTSDTSDTSSSIVGAFLSSSTNITLNTTGTATRNTYWQLIEFN